MFVYVHMLAFMDEGCVRPIWISDKQDNNILETTFALGQEYFPKMPSVSAGDVIDVSGNLYLICFVGFQKLTSKEFFDYTSLDRINRHLSLLKN